MHYIQALRRRGEETGGPAHPLPPPSHAHTHTFYETYFAWDVFLEIYFCVILQGIQNTFGSGTPRFSSGALLYLLSKYLGS